MNRNISQKLFSAFLILIAVLVIPIFAILFAPSAYADSVDLYWIEVAGSGTGNWSDTSHWSTSSDGAGGHAAPISTNNVHFDSKSFKSGAGIVTLNVAAYCKAMDWTGALNNPTWAFGNNNISVYGNITTISNMVITSGTIGNGFVIMANSDITTNGLNWGNPVLVMATAGLTTNLLDNFSAAALYLRAGTLNTNNHTINASYWTIDQANPTTLSLGSSVVNLSASTGWNYTGSNLTLTPNTATINDAGSFKGNGLTTYNIVNLTGTSQTISGSNTFNALNLASGVAQTISFTDGTTQTITTANLSGSQGHVHTLRGTSTGGWIISVPSGTINTDYANISYSTATGGATFNGGNASIDGGHNHGWNFPPLAISTNAATGNSAWTLYSNSPVMNFGDFASVWYDGTTYHAYYAYNSYTDIGHATSPDGINWTNDTAHNPVLTMGPGTYDNAQIAVFNAWKEGSNWYALYRGNGSTINLATSSDGVSWTKYGSNPVINNATYAQDPAGIIKVGSTYYLYTNTASGYGSNRSVSIYTSTDLHSWTRTGTNTFTGGRFCSAPFKYNNNYYLLVSKYYNGGTGGRLELYEDSNPNFTDSDRVFEGAVALDANHIIDTPTIVTNTIDRDSFPNNQLYAYYSKSLYLSGFPLYLTIQNNIANAVANNNTTNIAMDKDGVTSGLFNGTLVNAGGAASGTGWFQYGTDTNYGTETSHLAQEFPEYLVALLPNNLVPGQTYHYRAAISNGTSTAYGSDQSFVFTMPTVTTQAAVGANFNGNITNMGNASSTYAYFEYGSTTSYGSNTPHVTEIATGAYTSPIPTSLNSGATYHYRAVTLNGAVTSVGADQTFTIPNSPSSLGPSAYVTGSWGNTNNPALQFTQEDPGNSVEYTIQIATDSGFSPKVVDYTSGLMSQGATSFQVGQAAGIGTYATGSQGQVLSDGSYYWRVMSTNNNGETSSWTTANSGAIAFKVDIVASAIASITSTNSAGAYKVGDTIHLGINFSETVTATSTAELILNTTPEETCAFTVSNSASSTCDYVVQVGDNVASLDVAGGSGTITDVAGNPMTNFAPAANLSASKTITIDTVAPTVSISSFPIVNSANQNGVTVSGVCTENGLPVSLTIGSVTATPTCSSGAWSTTVDLHGLSDGTLTADVSQTDIAGNAGSNSLTATKDTGDPDVSGLSNDSTPRKAKTWSWGYGEESATFRYAIDQIMVWTATGDFATTTAATQSSGNGTYYLHVQAQDGAGNVSAVATVSAVLDNTAPVITVSGDNPATVAQGSTYTDSGATATDNIDSSVAVTSSGSVNTATLGDYTISYNATDIAGNAATTVTRLVHVTDQTASTIRELSDDSMPRKTKIWTWSGETGDTFRFVVDRNATTTLEGEYGDVTSATQAGGNGTYYLHVQSKDAANNESEVVTVFAILDNNAPTITITDPNTDKAQSKILTAITSDGLLTMSITTGSVCDGSLTFVSYADHTFVSESDNGKKICYKAIDTAGNAAYQISEAIGGIDVTPPSILELADDLARAKSKTWNWSGEAETTFRFAIDQNPSWTAIGEYGDVATVTQAGGNGIYYLHVQSKDAANNESEVVTVFALLDNTAPTITETAATASRTASAISWTTGEAASSKVEYGLTDSYGEITEETDIVARVTGHSVNLSGLDACSTYHYRAISKDGAGNEAIGGDETFKTECGSSQKPSYGNQAQVSSQIQNIQQEIARLQSLLGMANAGNALGNKYSCAAIVKNLYFGMANDPQVYCLQEFLTGQGVAIYPEARITGNFYQMTKAAVIRFQEKHQSDILTPFRLTHGNGFVGLKTRQAINQLIGN